jgi:ferredoxin-NADP reductase
VIRAGELDVRTPLADIHPQTPAPRWTCEEDNRLVCRAIIDETHDVKSFVFAPPVPRLFVFVPGQFLTFELPVEGGRLNRCYTISSTPTRPHTFSITVKRKTGGAGSNWLHNKLRIGDTIRATGPIGDFSTEVHPCEKRLFLSGGSGITPLMAMARYDYDLGEDPDTKFVHCARTPKDIIFRHELDLMARRRARLQVTHLVERVTGELGWSGHRGRISRGFLDLVAPDFCEREIFCCGPAPFMAAVRALLREAGFNMTRYHEESFVFEDRTPPFQELSSEVAIKKSHTITFGKSGRSVSCDEETTILAAARAAGLRLPSSCTKGLCGTCKTRKISGEVDMAHAGGIRQREIDQGFILLCCSRPRGDVVLDR